MESRYSLHIAPAEWRWVIIIATIFVLFAFVPLLFVAVNNSQEWQFMGVLHNYLDGGSYISKMVQGERGQWLLRFQHTSEDYGGAFIQVLYPLLGHLSRITSLPPIAIFHLGRVLASLFMYVALYNLAASIWQRVRTRRIFFLIASLGAGFGWLFAPLTGVEGFPDLYLPEAFPLLSTVYNVHFPLAIACLALLAAVMIQVFRPGADQRRETENWIGVVGLLSVILAFLYPQALVPFGAGLGLYVVITSIERRSLNRRALNWLLAVVLPAVPIAAYYAAVVNNIPAFAQWNQQNVTTAPPIWVLALGFGIPLLLALPGMFRAVRRFNQSDDALMLLWLAAMIVLIYLPTNVQRRFAVGMMIPIAYFATRAFDEVWFKRLNARRRTMLLGVLLPLMSLSLILMVFLPVLPILTGNYENAEGPFLEREYAITLRWLDLRTRSDSVVLAAPIVSAWIPGWAESRVVYGHPYETLNAQTKLEQVEAWYAKETATDCHALLEQYEVQFIIIGPQERQLGPVACESELTPVIRYGQVSVYAP